MLLPAAGNLDQYKIARSLRFDTVGGTPFLSRTPAGAGNLRRFSLSLWLKRSILGTTQELFSSSQSVSNALGFGTDNKLYWTWNDTNYIGTNLAFRDTTAWYHIYAVWNTDQANPLARQRIYVNGVLQATTSVGSAPAQFSDSLSMNTAALHYIGRFTTASPLCLEGYLADVHFIDGPDPGVAQFGYTDGNGEWQPKEFTGAHGTNGWHLDFSDNSNTTATTLGKDRVQGNNWTPGGFSVASGSGNDSVTDTPTEYFDGVLEHGNYPTFDHSWFTPANGNATLANGNMTAFASTTIKWGVSTWRTPLSVGKYYWEVYIDVVGTRCDVGISSGGWSTGVHLGASAQGYGYASDGNIRNNNVSAHAGSTFTSGDVIGVAYDGITGKLYFSKNGVWQNSGDPAAGTGYIFSGIVAINGGLQVMGGVVSLQSSTVSINYGQRPFAGTIPAGFTQFNALNLPDNEVADTTGNFSGTGSTDGFAFDMGGIGTGLTVDGVPKTLGTDFISRANGMKYVSATNNAVGSRAFSSVVGTVKKYARAQVN